MRCQRTILPWRHAFPDIFLSRLFDTVFPLLTPRGRPSSLRAIFFSFFLTSNTSRSSRHVIFLFLPSPFCPSKKFLISMIHNDSRTPWHLVLNLFRSAIYPFWYRLRWWCKIFRAMKQIIGLMVLILECNSSNNE